MADVVTSQTIVDTVGVKTVMKFTNISELHNCFNTDCIYNSL